MSKSSDRVRVLEAKFQEAIEVAVVDTDLSLPGQKSIADTAVSIVLSRLHHSISRLSHCKCAWKMGKNPKGKNPNKNQVDELCPSSKPSCWVRQWPHLPCVPIMNFNRLLARLHWKCSVHVHTLLHNCRIEFHHEHCWRVHKAGASRTAKPSGRASLHSCTQSTASQGYITLPQRPNSTDIYLAEYLESQRAQCLQESVKCISWM